MADSHIEKKSSAHGRSLTYAYMGQSVGVILFMLLTRSAFGTLFIKHIGGSDRLAMWILALPGVLRLLQIPLSIHVSPERGKQFLLKGWLLFGTCMLAAALLPLAIADSEILRITEAALLIMAFVFNISGMTFWFPLLHDIIPREQRGRFFGKLRSTWSVLLFLAILSSGLYLGESPTTAQFRAVILVGLLLLGVRHFMISRVPEAHTASAQSEDHQNWREHIRYIISQRQVVRFMGYFLILGFTSGFLGQPLVLYMQGSGFSPRNNIIVFGFITLGMVIALYIGGRAVDRLGTQRVFKISHLLLTILLFSVTAIMELKGPVLIVSLSICFTLSGAAIAVANLACTAQLFHYAPVRGRAFFLSVVSFLASLGPSVANLFAGALLGDRETMRTIWIDSSEFTIFQLMLFCAGAICLCSLPLLKKTFN